MSRGPSLVSRDSLTNVFWRMTFFPTGAFSTYLVVQSLLSLAYITAIASSCKAQAVSV